MKIFLLWSLPLVFAATFLFAEAPPAQVAVTALKINTSASKITVKVFKSGMFSAFGDNHTITAPLASASLNTEKGSVELRFNAKDMRVVDPGSSDSKRAQVQSNMESEKVLDSARFPEIKFVSTSVAKQLEKSSSEKQSHVEEKYLVHGNLTLHGTTKLVDVLVSFKNSHYSGSVKLKQTDFGITPITIAGGAIKVKDEIEIMFDIATGPAADPAQ